MECLSKYTVVYGERERDCDGVPVDERERPKCSSLNESWQWVQPIMLMTLWLLLLKVQLLLFHLLSLLLLLLLVVQLLLLFHLVSLLFAVVVEYVPVVIAPIAVPRFGLFVLSIGPLLRFFTFVVVKTFCCKNGNWIAPMIIAFNASAIQPPLLLLLLLLL